METVADVKAEIGEKTQENAENPAGEGADKQVKDSTNHYFN